MQALRTLLWCVCAAFLFAASEVQITPLNLDRETAHLSLSSDGKTLLFEPEKRQETRLADIPFWPREIFASPDDRYLFLEDREDPKRRGVVVHDLL